MQILILPMLVHAFKNGQNGHDVDPFIINSIVEKMLDPSEELTVEYRETLRKDFLQLAMLLLNYLHNDILEPLLDKELL